MSTTSEANLYRCHWCFSINDSTKNEWCLCTSAQRSLSRRWQASRAAQPQAPASEVHSGPVLLVVDDVKTIHTVVDTILTGFFGTIVHAYNGAEAFRIARTIHPDILLTDALLPGLDGRDVVRLLKADPATASTKTIIMTGLYKGLRYRNEAFRNFHVDAYLEKPVGAAELRAVVTDLLETITRVDAIAS